jgi:3-(3-hydroxy-phenyl)propionate hydroxylase
MAEYDVVIAGYGPTGAVAASLLGAYGVKVLVLEPKHEIYDIPRAVHFDGEVMRIFQSMGLAEQVASMSATGGRVSFVNGRNWTLMTADLSDLPRPHGWAPANFFNQPRLEEHLRLHAAQFSSIEVRLGWELVSLSQNAASVELVTRRISDDATETVPCRYLLGCDGASSRTRGETSVAVEDLHCDDPWLVCDLILEEGTKFKQGAFQFCDPARPGTLVTCEDTHIRWAFMLRPGDDPAALEDPAATRAMMAPHMHRLAPGLSAEDGELIRSKVYSFHALVAESFQDGRVFLLGDAAHQMPPFLGQGMCAGIRDAYNLCWKLRGVIQGRYTPKILESYSSERRPHVHEIVTQAVKIGAVIQTTNPWRAFMRDCLLLVARSFPVLAPPMKLAPTWGLGPGLFADNAEQPIHRRVRNPILQSTVDTGVDDPTRFDELLGDGFTLLGLGVDPEQMLTDDCTSMRETLQLDTIHVGGQSKLQSVEQAFNGWLKDGGGQ